ncbi:MAG: hypothetical protein IKP72_16810 [Clostridia bacterium]|nr:hypothetical protein [Clostridia bacterium]
MWGNVLPAHETVSPKAMEAGRELSQVPFMAFSEGDEPPMTACGGNFIGGETFALIQNEENVFAFSFLCYNILAARRQACGRFW